MHRAPAHRWTVNELAVATGMSRSTFAQRFKALVGVAPLAYLLGWRMRLAAHELLSGGKTVGAIALLLGYESESAFSNAFRRVMGCAPTHYRARHRPAPESPHATLRSGTN
jgi:AraC-like DNA-binding protein